MSKSRLAPVNTKSLPQLELTALNIAARLAKFIIDTFREEIEISQIYLWTDSQICLNWVAKLNACKRSYVRQKVANHKENVPNTIFKHVCSELNIADLLSLTRGVDHKKIS